MVNTARPFIRPATAARMKRLRDREFATDQLFFDDVWSLWRSDRPNTTWDAGVVDEQPTALGSGVGTLYEQGIGGPQIGDGMIHIESPYRLETLAIIVDQFGVSGMPSPLGAFLVINGNRRFAIDLIKVSDVDDRFASVYLTEQFGMPIPVEVAP